MLARGTEYYNLEDWLVHHLRSNIQRDPLLFLSLQPFNSQPGKHTSPMDRFVYKCLSAQKLSIDNHRNQIRWLFSTLVIGDLGVAMFGKKRIPVIMFLTEYSKTQGYRTGHPGLLTRRYCH